MVIDSTDSLYDFSDILETYQPQQSDIDEYIDDEVFIELNDIPRRIGEIIAYYELLLKEAETRQLLVQNEPIPLQERTDDWLAERRANLRTQVSVLKRQDEAIKAERDSIDQEFIRRFTERNTSGTRASNYTIAMGEDDNYPEMYDRTAFEDYLLKTGKLHLLQKRLSLSAIQEELAVLREEQKTYLDRLRAAKDVTSEAAEIYTELSLKQFTDTFDNEDVKMREFLLKPQIAAQIASGSIVDSTYQLLAQYYSLPGIHVVKRVNITQVKRSK